MTLDNPAFEKEFKVHTSNESEARALLTPSMIEHLLTLRRQAGKPVFLAFKDRRAYVGVHYGRTLFEPGIAQEHVEGGGARDRGALCVRRDRSCAS